MDRAETTKKVLDIVKKYLRLSHPPLLSTCLKKDLRLDSAEMAGLIMRTEDEFGINIVKRLDDRNDQIVTVGDLVTCVERELSGGRKGCPAEKTFKIKWDDEFWAFGDEALIRILQLHYRALDKKIKELPKFSVEEVPPNPKPIELPKPKPIELPKEIKYAETGVHGLLVTTILAVNRIIRYLLRREGKP